jgi:hypothetical protein
VVPGAFAGPWTPLSPPLPGANPFRGGPDRTRRKATGYGWWGRGPSDGRRLCGQVSAWPADRRGFGRGFQVRSSYEWRKVRRGEPGVPPC